MVCVHLDDTAKALSSILRGVIHIGAGGQLARIYPEECQLAHKRVCHDFESQGREGGIVICGAGILLLRARDGALDSRDIQRRGQQLDDIVEHGLHAFIAIGRAAANRDDLAGNRALSQARNDLFSRELFAVKEFLHQLVAGFGGRLDQFLAVFFGLLQHICRDIHDVEFRARLVASIIEIGLHVDQVDNADKISLFADRQLQRNGMRAQTIDDHIDNVIEICAHDIHLVDIAEAGNAIALGLAPNCFGLGLNAALCAEHGDSAIQHAQGALNLDREVYVSGSIDDVDAMALPLGGGCSRLNRDAAFLLLLHKVHRRGAVMHLADFIRPAGIEQNALGRRGFARIDMGHDADISNFI